MTTTEIPETVLTAASNINLRDLLESPTFQAWLVSAVSNALGAANATSSSANDDDQYLQFKLHQMMRAIPYETRRECFGTTSRLIRERKAQRMAY
ncbi:MAG: hypothetical protein ACO22O_12420 [bacterium]